MAQRRRRPDLFTLITTSLKSATLIAVIAGSLAQANIVGSDFQSFNPTSDGLDFVTVQSVRTLPVGFFNIGGFVDQAFNTLPPALDTNGNKFKANDRVLSSDVHFALGLTKDWELGSNVSSILAQSVDSPLLNNYLVQSGLSDFRANTKYRLTGKGNEGLAFNLTADFPLLLNDPFYGGGNGNSYDLELIWQKAFSRWQWGLNGGFRFRNPGSRLANSPYEPVGNQWLASTALAYHFSHSNWTVISEVFSSVPTSGTPSYTSQDLTAVEALLGIKYWGFHSLAVHSGVTAEISRGTSSPDFRIYAGLNWYPFRLWGSSPQPQRQPIPPPRPNPTPRPVEKPIDVALMAPAPTPYPTPQPVPAFAATSDANDTSVFDKEPDAHSERFVVQNINFEPGSAVVPRSFEPYLRHLAEYLRKGRPFEKLTIYGHTDSQGGAIFNQELSLRRADAVKTALIERENLPPEKIETEGLGASTPVATNDTAEGRSRNRRVEFRIDRD